MIIAVDGPTASGKGTIARALAAHYGLPHLDTGLLYRAVGRQCQLDHGNPDDPAEALASANFPDSLLADPILRTEESGGLASRVSVHPGVRQALYDRQRLFATRPGGAVLDGRDIGTVIAPRADVKLFVTASIEVRARRRVAELLTRGTPAHLEDVIIDLKARDSRDSSRLTAPLEQASDALRLDTSDLDVDAAIAAAIDLAEKRLHDSVEKA